MKFFFILTFSLLSWTLAAHSQVSVQIERVETSKWVAHYKFETPVSEAIFLRNSNHFRHKTWKSLTPGIQVQLGDSGELISSIDSKNFTEVQFEVKSHYDSLVKDYEFSLPFTDKSEAMFTGHFNVYYELNGEAQYPQIDFSFLSPQENIIILGKKRFETSQWSDKSNGGTYVYFGNIEPIETKELLSVVDPGMPGWLKEQLFNFMPKLFLEYKKQTGTKLNQRPLVLFNYNPNRDGIGSGGGVLPGVVQLRVEGRGWQIESEDLKEHAVFLLAHESAHLWNSQLFFPASNETSYWLHEGGANVFAFRTMNNLGVIDRNRLYENYSSQLNKCIKQADNLPLNKAYEKGLFKAYYTCGSTIGLMTEKALEAQAAGSIFDFWATLFKASGSQAGYTQQNYFDLLQAKTSKLRLKNNIEKFVEQGVPSAKSFFIEELKRLGFLVTEESNSELKIWE